MLSKKFENNRVVFWYDKDGQFSEDFQNIELDDVKKLAIGENEFVIKYQILRKEPNQKFLLYKNGEKPDNKENWLLDILLANDEFQTEVWAITAISPKNTHFSLIVKTEQKNSKNYLMKLVLSIK